MRRRIRRIAAGASGFLNHPFNRSQLTSGNGTVAEVLSIRAKYPVQRSLDIKLVSLGRPYFDFQFAQGDRA